MIRLIIFDLDDTLYPERDFVMSGLREVAKYMEQRFHIDRNAALRLLLEEFYRDRKYLFDRVLKQLRLYRVDYVQELVEIYRTHKPAITLYPDAAEVLPFLTRRFRLGMITDGYPFTQKQKVKALGIEEYFSKIIYTGEKPGYSKPSSKPFVDMLASFSLLPSEAVYVGDNLEKDFKGPREIGMRSIRVLREGIYRNVQAPDGSYLPDFEVTSLFELILLIDTLQ